MKQEKYNFIQEFEILGLFGEKDVCLNFKDSDSILILLGKNGWGKTTVLNALYYVLNGQYKKLLDINFSSIRLRIDDEDYILEREVLERYVACLRTQHSSDIDIQHSHFYSIKELQSVIKKKGLSVLYWDASKVIEEPRDRLGLEDKLGIEYYESVILKFRDVCNKYLADKQFVYDPISHTLKLYRHINGKTLTESNNIVDLDKLSHGEKRILSIFSKIYLGDAGPYTIMLDEPERSLSIPWQEKLLSDILDSDNCKFLLVMTHSPFIFNNPKLKHYTYGLHEFVKP